MLSNLIIPYPHINPIAVKIGPIAVHWYGLMYLLAFWLEYHVLVWMNKVRNLGLEEADISEFLGYLILGVVVGGRLGYVLFYNPLEYLHHPAQIIAVWQGGMSFHGGLVGTILGGWWWCRKKHLPFLSMADIVLVGVPLGLALGRLGNFINGELWGKVTSVPWAMVFPSGGPLPRHPSQLYELGLEGIGLFSLLAYLSWRRVATGVVFGTFLAGYGLIRCFVELFRNPDPQFITQANPSGTVLGPFSMGQTLSIPMVLLGLGIAVWAAKRKVPKAPPG